MRKKQFTRYVGLRPAPTEFRQRLAWFRHVTYAHEQIVQILRRTLKMFGTGVHGYAPPPDYILHLAKYGSKHARTFIRSFERSYIIHSVAS